MKFVKTVRVETEATKVRCVMNVRYWEDTMLNGKTVTEDGLYMPLRVRNSWDITIDLETGKVKDWPKDAVAEVHFKVCDEGVYYLLAEDGSVLSEIDGYVPSFLSPGKNGYGDYVILNIDGAGYIEGWNVTQETIQSYFDTNEEYD